MRKSLFSAALLLAASAFAQQPITGFSAKAAQEQAALEAKFDAQLSAQRIGQYIKDMSSRPHHVGSPGGEAVAQYLLSKFKSFGLDARIETYQVLFPTPKTRVLEMTGPTTYKAILKEPALKEDATSAQTKEQLDIYNCWSADGDVSGELVYVNFGLPEDYEKLASMGIDVKGKIVIARYGRSWRGIKPKVAQEHGAVGCIIYSDPKEDGYYQGDVYPKGAWKNEYGAQRGSVMDMVIYPGDPLTPNVGATADAKRLKREEATNLLKIPVLPIGYKDALPLLSALEGPVVPEEWRGALPITYHAGPGKAKVHLKLEFDWQIRPAHNVIAMVKGAQYPDQWVIRGNHHDAWVNGADDPISGMAALLEEAYAVGELMKTGWRPKRTMVFCGWDAEEPGLLGSTEWVEDHAKELQEKTVVYINSDGNSRGFLGAGGSHALETFVTEVARDIEDPQTKVSVLERKKAQEAARAGSVAAKKAALSSKGLKLGALGSGSDYSPFFQHLGIPSLNIGYGGEGEGGSYHSIYDSYDHYARFKDPGFAYCHALAKTTGRAALRMANADIVPFDFRSLHKTIQGYAGEVMALTDQLRETTAVENQLIAEKKYVLAADPTEVYHAPTAKEPVPYLDFSSLQNALAALEKAANSNATAIAKQQGSASLNQALYKAEQVLLSPNGLPRRAWYRHTIYAPGFYTGYGVKTLPGIREAIEQREWKEAQEQIKITAAAIQDLANYLAAIK
ncbi:MAG: M28 family peptidase [Chitinophagales bacterium]|nr:M28 family peptidase [Chitinophagales bacterium]